MEENVMGYLNAYKNPINCKVFFAAPSFESDFFVTKNIFIKMLSALWIVFFILVGFFSLSFVSILLTQRGRWEENANQLMSFLW